MENIKRILLVDDEESFSKIVQLLSKKIGFEFYTAFTVAEAKKILSEHIVDIAIIDFQLPDGNGGELNDYIKSNYDNMYTALCTGLGDFAETTSKFDTVIEKSKIVEFVKSSTTPK